MFWVNNNVGHYLSIYHQKKLIEWAKNPLRDFDQYDYILKTIQRLEPRAFHLTTDSLSTREFYHKPAAEIPYRRAFKT